MRDDDIRRDPFEQAVGIDQKTAASTQGALAAPMTAFIYDWNLLPLGQQLWLEWFETLKEFPPMQAPESYNLTQIMDQFKSPSVRFWHKTEVRHPCIKRALNDAKRTSVSAALMSQIDAKQTFPPWRFLHLIQVNVLFLLRSRRSNHPECDRASPQSAKMTPLAA